MIHRIATGKAKRVAIVGATAGDVRDISVEGASGIMSCAPDWCRPEYEPSKCRLTFPNGSIATLYSADKPDRLRGPQRDFAWVDEVRGLPGVANAAVNEGVLRVDMEDLAHTTPRVLTWLSEQRRPFSHVTSERPDLESVFLTLTGRSLRDS